MKNWFRFTLIVSVVALLSTAAIPTAAQAADEEGLLRLRVDPPVAGVFVDGKYRGTAATFEGARTGLPLPPGMHEVRLVDPRYEELVETVEIKSSRPVTLRRTLKKIALSKGPFGTLKVAHGRRSAVYINGKYYGQAGEFDDGGEGMLLDVGSYTIRVEDLKGEFSHVQADVKIEAEKVTTVTVPKS